MAETDDDVIASWHDRVGTLRKRGRVSAAALTVVPAEGVDVRRGRPEAPGRLSAEECALWEKLTFSRRPGWFVGAESLLESFVATTIQCQRIEAALRKAKPGTSERYAKLMRMHRGVGGDVGYAVKAHAPFEARQDPADGRRSAGGLIQITGLNANPVKRTGRSLSLAHETLWGSRPLSLQQRRESRHSGIAALGQGTKSLRSSPLRGSKSRETGSQVRR
jgi:hypothetical protein